MKPSKKSEVAKSILFESELGRLLIQHIKKLKKRNKDRSP